MGKQVQLLRGNTTENNNFTGLVGTLTYDTQTKCLRVHDGSTAGGKLIPSVNVMTDYVIAYQLPSSGNNYRWYRKYKSGWVEQGGLDLTYSTSGWQSAKTISLVVTMKDSDYNIYWLNGWTGYIDHETVVTAKTTTTFQVSQSTNYDRQKQANWQVVGIAA